jgi:hypothetical protein
VGEGAYDLSCLLRHAAALDPETPVLVEHLGAHEDYKRSVAYLKNLLTTLGSPRGLSG